MKDCADWVTNEFLHVEFGDQRLFDRFHLTAQRLACAPQSSIGQACKGNAETKGAYRMFANNAVESDDILDAHKVKTAQRMKGHKVLLSVQDTTFIEFKGHQKTEGLGQIGKKPKSETKGLVMHSALFFTVTGKPLGLASHKIWARPSREFLSRGEQKKRVAELPIEEKESMKWLTAMEETKSFTKPDQKIVIVGDRECDISEFISKANRDGMSFVVRNCYDRKTMENTHIREDLAEVPFAGKHKIHIPSRAGKKAREVEVGIRFIKTTLRPSSRSSGATSSTVELAPEEVVVIEVVELESTEKDKLHWYLLTNETVTSYSEACEKVRWYEKRWPIETFHKILKSGCNVEDCRLQSAEKLVRYITLMSIIAIRLFQLSKAGREQPEESCEEYLKPIEWKILFAYHNYSKPLPNHPPTSKEAVRWLGMLGGHQGRPSDGPVGPTVIWRGWQQLQAAVKMSDAIASVR